MQGKITTRYLRNKKHLEIKVICSFLCFHDWVRPYILAFKELLNPILNGRKIVNFL